jgi:hypothetical protein
MAVKNFVILKKVTFFIFIMISVNCSFGQFAIPQMKHRLLLADEGNSKVHYINLNNISEKWSATCSNRDMQLIGNDRILVSDNGGTGYSEFDLLTGANLRHVALPGVASGINSAFCLSKKEIFCACDGSPAKVIKIDSTRKILKTITLSLDASIRICRPTAKGTFIIGGKIAGMMCEFDSTGKKIWEVNAGGEPYMALRLPNGNTLISTGYSAQMVLADKQGTVVKKFPTEENKKKDSLFWKAANPNFFAGFQILNNGNIVVSNWQGHGTGHGSSGFQLLEFDSTLTKAVAYWKQDAALVSSLHGVLVLDSLDTKFLYSDYDGVLQPIVDPVKIVDHDNIHFKTVYSPGTSTLKIFDLQGRVIALRPSHQNLIKKTSETAFCSIRIE